MKYNKRFFIKNGIDPNSSLLFVMYEVLASENFESDFKGANGIIERYFKNCQLSLADFDRLKNECLKELKYKLDDINLNCSKKYSSNANIEEFKNNSEQEFIFTKKCYEYVEKLTYDEFVAMARSRGSANLYDFSSYNEVFKKLDDEHLLTSVGLLC